MKTLANGLAMMYSPAPVTVPEVVGLSPEGARCAAMGDVKSAGPAYLTPRQLEVLALLCEGLANKQIGRRLNIASATVKIHVARILRALGVSSRLQAVIAARRFGIYDESAPARLGEAPGSGESKARRFLPEAGSTPAHAAA